MHQNRHLFLNKNSIYCQQQYTEAKHRGCTWVVATRQPCYQQYRQHLRELCVYCRHALAPPAQPCLPLPQSLGPLVIHDSIAGRVLGSKAQGCSVRRNSSICSFSVFFPPVHLFLSLPISSQGLSLFSLCAVLLKCLLFSIGGFFRCRGLMCCHIHISALVSDGPNSNNKNNRSSPTDS